jgi:hypothetical protein
MRVDEVPQDDSILEGHRRACYAQDEQGRFVIATSRGWEVEKIANQLAVRDVAERVEAALREVRAGRASPLAYHMARCHMDVQLLAAHTGLWSFRIKRHLSPEVFARLPVHVLDRYAGALAIDVATLGTVPEDETSGARRSSSDLAEGEAKPSRIGQAK